MYNPAMHLKRFTAPNMQAAMKLIKTELGNEAIILDTRKVENNGQMGLEVTAAIDNINTIEAEVTPDINPEVLLTDIKKPSEPTKLGEYLKAHGVLPEISDKILSAVKALADTGFNDFDTLDMVLGKMIPFTTPARAFKKGMAHIFIGPTGSGKTTSLCKLAIGKKVDKHSIGMVTLDNQKVGAFEQLNIFAEAMKEQAKMIRTSDDFDSAKVSIGIKDFLFIDTPGLSPFNKDKMEHLRDRLKELNVDAMIHLVLPATLNPLEMIAVPSACAMLRPDTIIFTKIDETSHFGGLTNVAVMSGLDVCFVADGPRVPDDIMEMDSTMLAEKLSTAPKLPWETR